MITASVAMPMYKSLEIAWLAMEGLCRQKTKFKWELLMAEEQTEDAFSIDAIAEYKDRLKEAGCRRISYTPLDQWLPLGAKWYMLMQQASETSEVFILQATDCMSPTRRIEETCGLIGRGYNWVMSKTGYFYDVNRDVFAYFDKRRMDNYHPCGLNMAIDMDTARHVLYPEMKLRRGIDSWIYQQSDIAGRTKTGWLPDDLADGLDVHGYNNISIGRGNAMAEHKPPFMKTNYRGALLDKSILDRLKSMKDESRIDNIIELPSVTIGIVKTREELADRAIKSIKDQNYVGGIVTRVYNNMDKRVSIGKAYNDIVRTATTDMVGLIGDDDIVMPDYVNSMVSCYMRGKALGLELCGVHSYCMLHDMDNDELTPAQAAAPGIWEREFLIDNAYDESLPRYVNAEHYRKINNAGHIPLVAEWYYGYIYSQHNDNISGNKLSAKQNEEE